MLWGKITNHGRQARDRVAIKDNKEAVTYGDLPLLVDTYASLLLKHRIGLASRVVIAAGSATEFVISFLALYRLGATAVLLDHRARSHEISRCVRESGAQLLIAEDLHRTEDLGVEVTSPPASSLLGTNTGNRLDPRLDSTVVDSGVFCLVHYTSGVSGRPKCVPRTREQIASDGASFLESAQYRNDDRILCTTPLHHSYAMSTCLLPGLMAGASLYFTPVPSVPRSLVNALVGHRITVLQAVPFIYGLLSEVYPNSAVATHCLRLCIAAGEPLTSELALGFEKRFHIPITTHYGTTETGAITLNLKHVPGSVGLPIANVRVRVVDSTGIEVAANTHGEIQVSSPGAACGYLNNSELTNSRFSNTWFRTGDIGSKDLDGNIFLHGRLSEQINAAGNKIDPTEVEHALLKHPSVRAALVEGLPSSETGEEIVARVVAEGLLSESEIREFLARVLSPVKIPKRIIFVETLPRSNTGKLLRGRVGSRDF